jgi:hypothetical protein
VAGRPRLVDSEAADWFCAEHPDRYFRTKRRCINDVPGDLRSLHVKTASDHLRDNIGAPTLTPTAPI